MVMSTDIERETISLEKDADGVLRVSGTRVTLDTLVAAFQDGAIPEEIARSIPIGRVIEDLAVIAEVNNVVEVE